MDVYNNYEMINSIFWHEDLQYCRHDNSYITYPRNFWHNFGYNAVFLYGYSVNSLNSITKIHHNSMNSYDKKWSFNFHCSACVFCPLLPKQTVDSTTAQGCTVYKRSTKFVDKNNKPDGNMFSTELLMMKIDENHT